MNGYIIEKFSNMNNAYTSRRLCEEGEKKGLNMRIIGVYDVFCTDDTLFCGGMPLENADIVINRYKYGNIKDRLAKLGRISVNNIAHINKYVDKSRQLDITSSAMSRPVSLLANACENIENITAKVGFPFIAKGLCGSQGNMVYLVENTAQYAKLCEKFKGSELLFQQFISTSKGKDVRMLAIRGEVIGCMQRTAKSGFKANFALGADVAKYPIDADIKKIAADIYTQTKADILGIDLLFGKDGYVFCEINITPGIEGIETSTGVNAAGRIIELVK
ncbi:MAG: RimK family alpha-L-glutamate ligase [Firmicutes bacterium]|nr:RimK family alpha-L-glutamate ligase [Bacillota bacterium]